MRCRLEVPTRVVNVVRVVVVVGMVVCDHPLTADAYVGLAAPARQAHVGSFSSSTATTVSSWPADDRHVGAAARTEQNQVVRRRLEPAVATDDPAVDLLDHETGTLDRRTGRGDLEAEPHRVRDHPGQAAHLHVHGDHACAPTYVRATRSTTLWVIDNSCTVASQSVATLSTA